MNFWIVFALQLIAFVIAISGIWGWIVYLITVGDLRKRIEDLENDHGITCDHPREKIK